MGGYLENDMIVIVKCIYLFPKQTHGEKYDLGCKQNLFIGLIK